MNIVYENTILPVDVYGDTVKMIFCGDYFDHKYIIAENTRTKEKLSSVVSDDDLYTDSLYKYKCYDFSKLPEGEYVFYTSNNEDSRSSGIKLTVTQEDKDAILLRAIDLYNIRNDSAVREYCNKVKNDNDIILDIFKKYKNTENEKDKQDYAYALYGYIDILNTRTKKLSLTSTKFYIDSDTNSFEFEPNCQYVLRFDIGRNKIDKFEKAILNESYTVLEEDDSLYVYFEFNERGLISNYTLSFVPNNSIRTAIKKAKMDIEKTYQRALERTVDYPLAYLTFSDKELEFISIIDKLRLDVPLFKVPDLSYEYGYIKITPPEEYAKLFDLIADNLYLAINEPEYCLQDNRRRVQMRSYEFTQYVDKLGLGAEPYIYWLESENGTIVSDIKVIDLSSDIEPIDILYDSGFNKDLNERIRKFDIYHYKKHLIPYIYINAYDKNSMLDDAIKICDEDEISDSPNIARHILEQNFTKNNLFDFEELAEAVMEDKFVYGRINQYMFSDPIYYRYKKNTIVLPIAKNVVYHIEMFNLEDGYHDEYIPSSSTTTKEYRFDGEEYAFVSALNINTMQTSGFIMLNFSKHSLRADTKKFMIEKAEVGY